MEKRLLGKTGIQLSELGYGAAALFGKNAFGKQGINDEEAYELFTVAISGGINFFDTGINYGYAEERLGNCLTTAISEGVISREQVVVETKFGEVINPDGSYGSIDFSSEWAKKSLEISLKRMKLDYVDLFAMHGGNISDCSDKLLNTLQEMKSQGLIRAFGINTFDSEVLEWIGKNNVFDYVMLDYSIIKQEREPIIQKLSNAGIGVIAGMALGQSLFSKNIYKIKGRNDLWYLLRTLRYFRGNLGKSKDFRFLTKQKDYSANQLALRYVIDNPGVCSAVFSTTKVSHLKENLIATSISMPESIRKRIREHA